MSVVHPIVCKRTNRTNSCTNPRNPTPSPIHKYTSDVELCCVYLSFALCIQLCSVTACLISQDELKKLYSDHHAVLDAEMSVEGKGTKKEVSSTGDSNKESKKVEKETVEQPVSVGRKPKQDSKEDEDKTTE